MLRAVLPALMLAVKILFRDTAPGEPRALAMVILLWLVAC